MRFEQVPSHGQSVTNPVRNLFSTKSPLVAPIQLTYQQLVLWVKFIFRPLVDLINLCKPSKAAVTFENSLQDISTVIDTLVQQRRQERQIPSVVMAVIHQGQIIKTAAYGKAQDNTINPDDKLLEANTDTVYRVDSLSKQFTATAIIKLVEQGLAKLDEPIHTYLENTPPAWETITVRQLITHQAGFQYQLDEGEYPSIREQDQFPISQDYLARLFAQKPDPGKHIYSNIGYDILGIIIKNVTQKPYSAFMQETFFTPLKMSRTGIFANASNTDNFAIGYALQPGEAKNLTATNSYPDIINEDIPLAGAGILSTIEDMAQWELALQGNQLLSEASKHTLEHSLTDVWTRGRTDTGTPFLSASGVGWGYNASFIRYPASQSAVIVIANFDGTTGDSANIAELAFEIAQLYPFHQ